MIDPMTTLAFSIFSQKGRYALLIGSGVSRAAGILTGYEITLDLIRQVALANNDNYEEDAKKWYREKFKKEPDYSDILSILGKTRPGQIKNILRPYFEPNEDDKAKGLKIPTQAHKSIAELVREGFIKVIITTNFDKLIENAITEAIKPPFVIKTSNDISGMEPLEHLQETDSIVIKVNGDYLDTRIKNTEEELKKYNPKLKKLIKDIFEKYGIIMCGWSGEYDIALIDILTSAENRRYSTYFTYRSPLKPVVQDLINNRQAETIQIESADTFFQGIADRVLALKSSMAIHPASKQIAVDRLKRYLTNDQKIYTHDLIMKEAEIVYKRITSDDYPTSSQISSDEFKKRIKEYELILNTLLSLFIIGLYWDKNDYKDIWMLLFNKFLNDHFPKLNNNNSVELNYYPSLLLIYATGIISVHKDKYETLYRFLNESSFPDKTQNEKLISIFEPSLVLYDGKILIDNNNDDLQFFTPQSNYLCNWLEPIFKELLLIEKDDFIKLFDTFEYLLNLIKYEYNHDKFAGCFWLRYRDEIERKKRGWSYIETPIDKFKEKVILYKNESSILKDGFFKKSFDNFMKTIESFDPIWMNQKWNRW